MKRMLSFDLKYDNGLCYTRLMEIDSDFYDDLRTRVAEDWDSRGTFYEGSATSEFCDVLVFSAENNLESDFWEGELRIYHVRGIKSFENFVLATATSNLRIIGTHQVNSKETKISYSPAYDLDLSQIFSFEFEFSLALDNLNTFGLDMRNFRFDYDRGGVLEKSSYFAGEALKYLNNEEKKDYSFYSNEVMEVMRKWRPDYPIYFYSVLAGLIIHNFKKDLSKEHLAKLLYMREQIFSFCTERGVEPGLFDYLYEDFSKEELAEVQKSSTQEEEKFSNSELGHFLKSFELNSQHLRMKKKEIDLLLHSFLI